MNDEEITKAWQLVHRFGPSNNWTGTNGPLAAALGRALKEVERLKNPAACSSCGEPIPGTAGVPVVVCSGGGITQTIKGQVYCPKCDTKRRARDGRRVVRG